MIDKLNILVVEDNQDDYELLIRNLKKNNIKADSLRVQDEPSLIDALESNRFDVVLSDNSLPTIDAARALKVVRSLDQNVPFIIISGTIPQEKAINAMYNGVHDFLVKDDLSKLAPTILREVKEANNRSSRAKVEKQLLITEESYQALAHSIMDVFFAIDESFNITYWNETAKKEFNIVSEEVVGKYLYQVFPNLSGSILDTQFREAMETKSSRYSTFKYSKRLHGINSVDYFDASIYPSGGGASVILKKITDKKMAEYSLKKINKELETLVYRLSHEIQGPMSSIMGLINIGKMEFKDHKILELLTKQESSATELNKTLKTLMNLSEIKRDTIQTSPIHIKKVVDDILKKMKFAPGYDGIQVIVDIDPTHTVVSDSNLLQTILQNLIDNAIKYRVDQKPSLYLETIRHNSCLYLSIVDNGLGIPLDQQDKIFDMFYRANETSTGSGLGLYVVKNSIEKIQGSISMKSVEGKGCRFDMIIPDLQEMSMQETSVA